MGFKSVELQVAIPRSQDASRMQDQMMRQGQKFQDTLTEQKLREQLINRTKVNEFEHVRKRDVTDEDDPNKQASEKKQNEQKDKDENCVSIDHPYLGTKIDFSG